MSIEAQLRRQLLAEVRGQGVTQRELAHNAGLSQKHVSQLLLGRCNGSFEAWDRMAAALGYHWDVTLEDDS